MSTPRVTVTFPRPISGADVIGAVRELSDTKDTWFVLLPRAGGTCLIGQASSYPYRQLIVVPGSETSAIRPASVYESVEIRDYVWPGSNPFDGSCTNDLVRRNLEQFAQQLERHFVDIVV